MFLLTHPMPTLLENNTADNVIALHLQIAAITAEIVHGRKLINCSLALRSGWDRRRTLEGVHNVVTASDQDSDGICPHVSYFLFLQQSFRFFPFFFLISRRLSSFFWLCFPPMSQLFCSQPRGPHCLTWKLYGGTGTYFRRSSAGGWMGCGKPGRQQIA